MAATWDIGCIILGCGAVDTRCRLELPRSQRYRLSACTLDLQVGSQVHAQKMFLGRSNDESEYQGTEAKDPRNV
eukprot:5293319-Amphidinium_carterae.2